MKGRRVDLKCVREKEKDDCCARGEESTGGGDSYKRGAARPVVALTLVSAPPSKQAESFPHLELCVTVTARSGARDGRDAGNGTTEGGRDWERGRRVGRQSRPLDGRAEGQVRKVHDKNIVVTHFAVSCPCSWPYWEAARALVGPADHLGLHGRAAPGQTISQTTCRAPRR